MKIGVSPLDPVRPLCRTALFSCSVVRQRRMRSLTKTIGEADNVVQTGEPFSESSYSAFVQSFCFDTLAHPFAQWEDCKSCRFNHIHTLFIVTGGRRVALRSQGWPGPVAGPHRLGAVGSIDADVLRREVAGPEPRHGFASVQIHNQRNLLGERTVTGCGRAYPPWPCYS